MTQKYSWCAILIVVLSVGLAMPVRVRHQTAPRSNGSDGPGSGDRSGGS
jgi:hypothetical protein